MRLLIIEDESTTVELIQEVLAPCRWNIESAGDLSDGLSKCRETVPDVVLLDLGLPGSTLFQVIAAIPFLAEKSAVVILTGNQDQVARAKAMANGAGAYIDKDAILSGGAILIKAIRDAWGRFEPRNKETSSERVRREISQAEIEMLSRMPDTIDKVDKLHAVLFEGYNDEPSLIATMAVMRDNIKDIKEHGRGRMLIFILAAVVQIVVAVLSAYMHQPIPVIPHPGGP